MPHIFMFEHPWTGGFCMIMCICGYVFMCGKKKYGIYYSQSALDEGKTCIMNKMLERCCVCVCVF